MWILSQRKTGYVHIGSYWFWFSSKLGFLDLSGNLCKVAFNFLSLSQSRVHLNVSNDEHFIVAQIKLFLEEHSKENVECFEMLYSNMCEVVIERFHTHCKIVFYYWIILETVFEQPLQLFIISFTISQFTIREEMEQYGEIRRFQHKQLTSFSITLNTES